METIPDLSEITQLLERYPVPDFAKGLAELEPGLYSKPEIGFRVGGDNRYDRSMCYRLLDACESPPAQLPLCLAHGRELPIYQIEQDNMRNLFASLGVDGVE